MRNQVKDIVPYANLERLHQNNWKLLPIINNIPRHESPSQVCIIGTERCGMSLLSAILNCSPELNLGQELILMPISEFDGATQIDTINKKQFKFIWMVRHPLENTIALTQNKLTHYEDALNYWCHANSLIWNFLSDIHHSYQIRVSFEEILLSINEIKRIFEFADIPFNKQFIHYGDFEHPTYDDSFWMKGLPDKEKVSFYRKNQNVMRLWDIVKDKEIMHVLGFAMQYIEE